MLQCRRLQISLQKFPVPVFIHNDPIIGNHLLQRTAPLLSQLPVSGDRCRENKAVLRCIHQKMVHLKPVFLIILFVQHMLIKVVVVLKHHKLHFHSLRDADLLVHQRTFCLYIIIHRCPQRIECLCIADILQIEHKILTPADLRIHPDPEAVYEIAPVQLIPQHSIVIIRRILHHKRREFLPVDHAV